jgi:molybdopterin/thiamine biosynthesis adenylyltransferase/ubiquitin-protein ligase
VKSTGAEKPEPWYERDPERLEWELEQFAARGLPAASSLGLTDGRYTDNLVVATELPFEGQNILIEVAFPFEYPESPPTVYGPPNLLKRHQQPRDGNFCWSEDPDREWWPGADAAHLVGENVRWLLEDTEAGDAAVHAREADMPEPITGLITFDSERVVVVPDPFFEHQLPAAEGTMTLVGTEKRLFLNQAANLGSPDPTLRSRYFKDRPEYGGYWVELSPTPEPRVFESEDELLALIDAAAPRAFERLARRLKKSKSEPVAACWLGITFLEEGPLRGEQRRNWAFALVSLERASQKRSMETKLRSQALTLTERQRRTPELVGLSDARVLLIGAGSLGSPVAFELVKAGVGRQDIVDPDRVDVNNSVRHVLSPRWAGANKAWATALEAGDLNPFVEVRDHDFTVGAGPVEAVLLAALIADADVVLDTTGSNSVARILQRYCAAAATPLIVAGLSTGSWGGEVGVFHPGAACFECFVLAQRDKTIPEPHAAPPSSLVTLIGCSHPAFPGAGFDGAHLAAIVARTVVQVSGASSYPAVDFDWAVVNFRDAPWWESGRLAKHLECGRCS